MYLEGSDQHRGWFQSSLLVGLGTRGRPPFHTVLTHGFLIDLEGRKMSKSVGNSIVPQEVIQESGAEILRLWVASSDYAEELRVSKEILARVIEAYRKIRNTCRILVANLYDFDPAVDIVPLEKLEPVDRYALARYAEAAQRMLRAYDAYDFPTVFQTVNTLTTVDLSAFYIDVTKDRMYTYGARSRERRSAQTTMYLICDGLARLLAPILSVTADDLWRHMPGQRSETVHLEDFPSVDRFIDRDLMAVWERLMSVRGEVNAALEQKRKAKVIGNSLGARVTLTTSGPIGALLDEHRADLPMLFIVSEVALNVGPVEGADELRVEGERASGVKCDRCWRFVPSVRTEPDWAGICDRCVGALAEPVNR
jgi:isoleucyl-tRNA synthetase